MSLLSLVLTALFAVGALYVGIKVRDDWQAGRQGLIALGVAALIVNLAMLAYSANGLAAAAGFGFATLTGIWD